MAFSQETVEIIRKGIETRRSVRDPERVRNIERVEIEPVDGLAYRVHSPQEPEHVLRVDEPPQRGGTDTGPSPLVYFVTGAGTCLLNQLIRVSIVDGYDLHFSRMAVRADFRRDVGGRFEHFQYEVYAEGPTEQPSLDRLIEEAESFCYVSNTLAKAVKSTIVLHLNGEEVARRVSEPQ